MKEKKNVILVTGYPGSGKTTFANYLNQMFGYKIMSFATPLKQEVEKFLKRPINKATDRDLLIKLGTLMKKRKMLLSPKENEWLVQNFPDLYDDPFRGTNFYWADKLALNCLNLKDGNIVVDDCRFDYEVEIFDYYKENFDFKVVRINTSIEDCKKRLLSRDGGFQEDLFEKESEISFLNINADLII